MRDHPQGENTGEIKGDADQHNLDLAGHADAGHIDAPALVPDAESAPQAQPRKIANRLTIMSPSRADDDEPAQEFHAHPKAKGHGNEWDHIHIDPAVAASHDGKNSTTRKTSAIIAVAVVAGIAGALGTAMATAGVAYFTSKPDPSIAANHARALDESMNRIESDLAALRSNVDRAAKANASQSGKTADRLDRIEKAQADPAAKLAKLTDTVEKLRVATVTPPAPPLAPAAAVAPPAPAQIVSAPVKDVTGSVAAKEASPAPAAASKPEVARLPTVEGWVLVDAGNGGATIESRRGIYDVVAGDPVPGLGRVDAIRRQDGRWVVVTSKGLIVAR